MYLRIAPELYLKRLIVGGFERVFESIVILETRALAHVIYPEFTMMEFYAAYTDYRWIMDYTETVLRAVATSVTGSAVLSYNGRP